MTSLFIKVKVIKAILTHNTEIGSQMDPFVVLKMGTIQKRGQTFDQAGDMPVFNEQFQFPYQGHLTMFHLIVYDQDTTIDDLVGEVQIDLKPIISQQFTPRSIFLNNEEWYSLKYDGKKPAGKIMLEFQCNRDGLSQSQNQKIIKQLIKPNIHRIGPEVSQLNNEIHPLNSRHLHHNPQKIFHQIHKSEIIRNKRPKIVFSFRDYALQQEKYKQAPFFPNYTSNTHLSTQTLTSSYNIQNTLGSRNSSQINFPLYQKSQTLNHYPNHRNGSTISYVPYGQGNHISSLNNNQKNKCLHSKVYIGNNFNVIH